MANPWIMATVAAGTSPAGGTEPDMLAEAIRKIYGDSGITGQYCFFKSSRDLPGDAQVLAVIQWGLLVDHFVAIVSADDDGLMVADPLAGLQRWTHDEFDERWRKSAVVVRRLHSEQAQVNRTIP